MPRCFVNEKEKERLLGIKPKYLLSSEIYDPDTTDYLTITSLEGDNVLTLKKSNYRLAINELYYTTEEGKFNWKKIEWSNYGTEYKINFSKSVYLYGENPNGISNQSYYLQLQCSRKFECSGNIMTLIQKDGNVNTIPNDYCFRHMFSNSNIVKASNLKLSAETLKKNCYLNMFSECSHLISAPRIDGIELADYCCSNMFNGCTSLTTAPSLPATTLAQYCYTEMYRNCTSLTTISALPATDLVVGCYKDMFVNCTSLSVIPELSATSLATSCYYEMFMNCTSLTQAPSLPATTLTSNCYTFMFKGCTSLIATPELSANSLANNCYQGMFEGCTSLTQASSLPAETLYQYCYNGMFKSCTSLTTAPDLPATILSAYCYMEMFRGCTALTTMPELPAATLGSYCYNGMFYGCTSLITVSDLLATESKTYCYKDMFRDCRSLTNSPEIYTTPNSTDCFAYMFSGCTLLSNIKIHSTSWNTSYTTGWVSNVAESGTFYNYENIEISFSNSFVPVGWGTIPPQEMLTFKANAINSSIGKSTFGNVASEIYYSTNKIDWVLFENQTITVDNIDDEVYFYGNNADGLSIDDSNYVKFNTPNGSWNISGNLNSLIDSGTNSKIIPSELDYCFINLFSDCNIVSASNLILADNTTIGCYKNMFKNCTLLTDAPKLHIYKTAGSPKYNNVYNLANNCYESMFEGCTSLVIAPALSMGVLSTACYKKMFKNCTSLTSAPILNALNLTESCYEEMFYNCSSLSSVSIFAENISATNCLTNWLYGTASSGNFYCAMTTIPFTVDSVNGIPANWNKLTFENEYFTLADMDGEDGFITTGGDGPQSQAFTVTIYYSFDKLTWTSVTAGGYPFTAGTIPLKANSYTYVKCTATRWTSSGGSYGINLAEKDHKFAIYGNIASLIVGDNYSSATTLSTDKALANFFTESVMIDSRNLVFPFTSVGSLTCKWFMRNNYFLWTVPRIMPLISWGDSGVIDFITANMTLIKESSIIMNSTISNSNYNTFLTSSMNKITTYATSISGWTLPTLPSSGSFYNMGNAALPSGFLPEGWTEYRNE